MAITETRRPGRPETVSIEQLLELEARGLSHRDIGAEFGISGAAVGKRLRKYRSEQESEERKRTPWPWRIRVEHSETNNQLYKLMLAYRKHAAGEAVSERELGDANALRKASARFGMAITYDPDRGFMWTTRRPGEEDEMFVVR